MGTKNKETIEKLKSMKGRENISMLTCYDYSFSRILDGSVDILLVGDSMANVIYGYDSTKKISMEDMVKHVEAVAKGAKESVVVADMPFGSDKEDNAVENAKRFVEAGAGAVKVEGKPKIVSKLVEAGIDVMGHVGLLPQTAEKMRVYGREDGEAKKILQLAKDVEGAGAFSLVIESVPKELAKQITSQVKIPTIGIGAGSGCDGQVLVSYDMLGLYENTPGFVKKYVSISNVIRDAAIRYSYEVKKGEFP